MENTRFWFSYVRVEQGNECKGRIGGSGEKSKNEALHM